MAGVLEPYIRWARGTGNPELRRRRRPGNGLVPGIPLCHRPSAEMQTKVCEQSLGG